MPLTTLRYPGSCAVCRARLAVGATAFFDPTARTVSCAGHQLGSPAAGPVISARAFADRLEAEHAAGVRRRWGAFAPLALALGRPDRQVVAARKGAAGEERLGAFLDKVADRSGGRVVVLHDRRIPGRRENLDHVVVCPSGVWAVDAKAYSGRVSTGGWFTRRLTIGGRDGDRLVEQSLRQQRLVRAAFGPLRLPALPVDGALCFVAGELGWPHNGRRVQGVLVATPRVMRRHLLADGLLTVEQVAWVAHRLDGWFTAQ